MPMSSRRTARVASVIREVVSTSILTELRDPRIKNVTVLGADVSPDLRYASVRISVRGDERMASLTLHGLNSAKGYLQSKVADRIKSRYTPELRFILDTGVQKSIETSRLLKELMTEDEFDGDLTESAESAEAADDESAEDEIAGDSGDEHDLDQQIDE